MAEGVKEVRERGSKGVREFASFPPPGPPRWFNRFCATGPIVVNSWYLATRGTSTLNSQLSTLNSQLYEN
jgi:hypothetical protein